VNETATSTHGNVCIQSVFITPSGEWKLGGFELLSNPKDTDAAVLYVRSVISHCFALFKLGLDYGQPSPELHVPRST
jgi:hypothetical protein